MLIDLYEPKDMVFLVICGKKRCVCYAEVIGRLLVKVGGVVSRLFTFTVCVIIYSLLCMY